MEKILHDADVQEKAMSWSTLGYEASLEDVSEWTIKRAMGRLDYHKCVACRKAWVNRYIARECVNYANLMVSRYPNKTDWRHIRFSDEVHFSLGPQGKLLIIRKPGERYCSNCIQEVNEKDPKEETEKKRVHAWGACGYNFKSDLTFYTIPTNTNGKITMKVYRDEILEGVVKPWLRRGDYFVLEEDRDSSHGIGGSDRSIVKQWKKKNGLHHYFNCSTSPDLAPIENC
jgi:hypothetical protein